MKFKYVGESDLFFTKGNKYKIKEILIGGDKLKAFRIETDVERGLIYRMDDKEILEDLIKDFKGLYKFLDASERWWKI